MADKIHTSADSISDRKHELRRFFGNIKSRAESLFAINSELEEKFSKLDGDLKEQEETFSSDFDELSAGLETLKIDIRKITKRVESSIEELKSSAKIEDYERMQHFAGYWTPEEWITRKELERRIERNLEE